jgi:GNAT superfamily N-acetyltransferase
MARNEIEESNRHFREAWKLYARVSPGGEALDKDGLTFANAKQPWFFMNVGLLREPAVSESDLERRAKAVQQYFATQRNPWGLTASEDWFGPRARDVLSGLGLVYQLDLMGMAAERLVPAIRLLPKVKIGRIDDEESRLALADLNADSYSVPKEWGRLALGGAALWQTPVFGTIAYVEDEPAAGALALPIDDALYVGWVATAKSHRRQGLAELVMRASLEDASKATGLERTTLHATQDGLPVYLRMGYRPVVKFPWYSPA